MWGIVIVVSVAEVVGSFGSEEGYDGIFSASEAVDGFNP